MEDANLDNVEIPYNTSSLTINKSNPDLYNHKSLLERSESIGRLGYWEYDVKNENLWASTGARLIYGFDENEIFLHDIKKIVFPEFRAMLDEKFERLIKHNDKYEAEFKICRKYDGEIMYIRSQAEYNLQQKTIYGIIQDISLQKRTEEDLAKAMHKAEESDRLKSAFISNMSHEIRTPMNGIVGFAHLVIEGENDYETLTEYKEQIHSCCNQLLDKVNAILDISKIEAGQVMLNTEEVKINELINKIFENYTGKARKKNLEMRLNITNSIGKQVVLTDSTKLTTIISNLLDNAIRFTHTGTVELGYSFKDSEIEFYVKDTGIGISSIHHEIIFEPFRHANSQIPMEYGGTGLGLSIAKKYVDLFGGKIWFESQPGFGSTFSVTIPHKTNLSNLGKPMHLKKVSYDRTTLIVEDMEMNYIYLKVLIEELGFNVLWAKDGNEAIKMALENMDIELVLMDIRLPNTDGYEATRVIREKRPDLPIIAQTANALFDEREKALESGCNEYITKPIYKKDFRNTISKFFDI